MEFQQKTFVGIVSELKSLTFKIQPAKESILISKGNNFARIYPLKDIWNINGNIVQGCTPVFINDQISLEYQCFQRFLSYFQEHIPIVIVDPGHGGYDRGASSQNTHEKDLTLEVAKLIQAEANRRGKVQVILTREKDEFVDLNLRSMMANKLKAKAFVSIHFNWNKFAYVQGMEVYVLNQNKVNTQSRKLAIAENSAVATIKSAPKYVIDAIESIEQQAFLDQSVKLASLVSEQLVQARLEKKRGIFEAPFAVLHKASMPAILLELGYISNPQDRIKWKNKMYIETASKTLVSAMEKFFVMYPEYSL